MKPSVIILNDMVDKIVKLNPQDRIKTFTNLAKQLKQKGKTAQYWRMTNLADKVGKINEPDIIRKFSKQALTLYINTLKSKTKQKRLKESFNTAFKDAGAKIVKSAR
jgi:predicted transcriptional regulator